jgi:hypothetical protein
VLDDLDEAGQPEYFDNHQRTATSVCPPKSRLNSLQVPDAIDYEAAKFERKTIHPSESFVSFGATLRGAD